MKSREVHRYRESGWATASLETDRVTTSPLSRLLIGSIMSQRGGSKTYGFGTFNPPDETELFFADPEPRSMFE